MNLKTGETTRQDPSLPPGWAQRPSTVGKAQWFTHLGAYIGTWDDPGMLRTGRTLPAPWNSGLEWSLKGPEQEAEDRMPFFVNLTTGESTWEDPRIPRGSTLPPGWTKRSNESGWRWWFEHAQLDICSRDEPRISRAAGPVPVGWTSGYGWSMTDPHRKPESRKAFFVNLETGETTFEDPALIPSEDGHLPEIEGFRII